MSDENRSMKVLFREIPSNKWVKVVIATDSPVARALAGEQGDTYDALREMYKYIPDDQ